MGAHALNVLLVEDDQVDVMNVQRTFRKNHITNPLYVVPDGVAALEGLRDGTIPLDRLLVLLDLNMPRMNGLEFLREVRRDENLRHLAVVVLTTSDDERDRIEAYDLEVGGYIVKPVTFLSLVDAMATMNNYWTLVDLP